LAELIGSQTRLVDIVMEDRENGRFIILCPEIDSQGSRLLTDRIQQTLREKLSVNVSFGVASFPQQALTFESLVTEADNHLNHQQHSITNIPVSQEVLRAET
jgi:GGDEF domain-containing protein